MIIEERPARIGNFLVGRLLPFRNKRMVGPFAFIDHMGPVDLQKGEGLDVPPHPHIGLSTLTYLFEGSIMHRDSLGTEVEIKPGEVNWMTAGAGIAHSERTPDYLREQGGILHGLQIWVALPIYWERTSPTFVHIDKESIPQWEENGLSYRLIAGSLGERESPVPVYSPLYLIEIKSSDRRKVDLGELLFGESAMYILEGSVLSDGKVFDSRQILVAVDSKLCSFEMEAGSTIYIFGGEVFPEERFIYWNFVASDKALIEAAKERWKEQRFEKVPGETEFVPLPSI